MISYSIGDSCIKLNKKDKNTSLPCPLSLFRLSKIWTENSCKEGGSSPIFILQKMCQ